MIIDPDISHKEMGAFIRAHHYSHSLPNTSTYRFGLRADGVLVGASMWLPPIKAAALTVNDDPHAVLSLSRFALVDGLPKNTASMFLGRQMRLIDRGRWPVLLTYADEALGHVGTIYKATNWECLGSVPAGDVWISPDGARAGRKRGRFSYTVQQMKEMGFVKAPKANKIKFVHRVAS